VGGCPVTTCFGIVQGVGFGGGRGGRGGMVGRGRAIGDSWYVLRVNWNPFLVEDVSAEEALVEDLAACPAFAL
jgi:hypothetical protein